MTRHVGSIEFNESFVGKIVKWDDPKGQGRYMVHIPNLMQYDNGSDGIICKNRVHSDRMSHLPDGTSFGSYFPLHVGTLVIVKFHGHDYNAGWITEVISDHELFTMPTTNEAPTDNKTRMLTTDRDNFTTVFKTRNNCRMDISEAATSIFKYKSLIRSGETSFSIDTKSSSPADSISLRYKDQRTRFNLNDDGYHLYTDDKILIQSVGDNSVHIKANGEIIITGKFIINAGSDILIKSGTKIDIEAANEVTIKAGSIINLDAPVVDVVQDYIISAIHEGESTGD